MEERAKQYIASLHQKFGTGDLAETWYCIAVSISLATNLEPHTYATFIALVLTGNYIKNDAGMLVCRQQSGKLRRRGVPSGHFRSRDKL
jgi:hypothetical protein